MSVRAARWLLFGGLFLTLPLPMLAGFDALVPAVRYWILSGATAAVALREGAAGPVPGILALLALHALAYSALGWLVAWLSARLLAGLSPGDRRSTVLGIMAMLFFFGLAFEIYRTPFGRAATSNLIGILS